MPSHVRQGFVGLSNRGTARSYTMLGLNLLSQLVCVSGVNQLSSVRDNLLISSLATLAPTATRWHGACLRNCVQLTFFFPLLFSLWFIQRVSAVSTQVVLTARKAISLCFSVWWFSSGWNNQFACGAFMVFVGSFWYSILPALTPPIDNPG